MQEYELHNENIKTYHTLLKNLESEAEIIRVLIIITKDLEKRLEKKGIYYSGTDIYSWAAKHRHQLLEIIAATKSIIGKSFLSVSKDTPLEELKSLVTAEKENIAILFTKIAEMNKVSLNLVEHNLMLKKAREILED